MRPGAFGRAPAWPQTAGCRTRARHGTTLPCVGGDGVTHSQLENYAAVVSHRHGRSVHVARVCTWRSWAGFAAQQWHWRDHTLSRLEVTGIAAHCVPRCCGALPPCSRTLASMRLLATERLPSSRFSALCTAARWSLLWRRLVGAAGSASAAVKACPRAYTRQIVSHWLAALQRSPHLLLLPPTVTLAAGNSPGGRQHRVGRRTPRQCRRKQGC